MEVSLPADRAALHADGRWCTWMYETRNETTQADHLLPRSCQPDQFVEPAQSLTVVPITDARR